MRRSNAAPALGFVALLGAFWLVAKHFGIPEKLGDRIAPAVLSFELLLAPYWAFGFGFGEWLNARVRGAARTFVPLLLLLPYLVFTLPRGEFRWDMCLGMAGIVLAVSLLAPYARADWLVLAILGVSVDLHFFDRAWPVAGLTGMSKLLFVDAGLYAYLVIRPLGGIGFDFRLRRSDVSTGLREFAYYAPIALALGFALRFLHWHGALPGSAAGNPLAFGAGWLFTLFFVAMPEELFFRGLMLNMLERRLGTGRALAITSAIFGLAHFNKRAAYFNWRYVILAAVAGVFYGRAWLAKRRLIASSITHATVDTVWSIWLR
jgi:membrane protease YdiL (CAAX protease family)